MRYFVSCLFLVFFGVTHAIADQLSNEDLEKSKDNLEQMLNKARAVPYVKDGKVVRYVVESEEISAKDGLKIRRGDELTLETDEVVTGPNDLQEE